MTNKPNPQALVLGSSQDLRPAVPAPERPPYPSVPYPAPETELNFSTIQEYLQALNRRKWMIAGAGVAGLLIGLAATIMAPLPYQSRISIEIQGFNESFMKMNEVDPQANSGISGASSANILTQVRVLQSSTLRRRVLERLERETIPSLPPTGSGLAGAVNRLRSALNLNPAEPTRALREALQAASIGTDASAIEGTRVVEITTQSPHPEVAAEFLNALVTEFVDLGMEYRAQSAQRTSQWLANQLEEQKAKLEQAEARLADFVSKAGVQGLTQENNGNTLAQSRLQQLQGELSAIQSDRIAKQSRYEMAAARGVEAMPELVAGSALPALQGTLADLRRQQAELLAALTPAHYRVRRIQAQIDETEAAMQRERDKVLQRLRNEYEASLKREKLLAGAYAGQSGALMSQVDKNTQYGLMRREVDSNRQLYNLMVQQVNQAGVAAAVPTNNIRVIDAASPAANPSFRHVQTGGGLGGVTGLLFGCILAVLLHQLDRRVRTPWQLQNVLNVPELGIIPAEAMHPRRRFLKMRIGRHGVRFASAAYHRGSEPGSVLSPLPESSGPLSAHRIELVTHQHKPSPVAESFRATLMSILFSVDGQRHSVWSITSPNPKEGKSTVASNLAIALAELRRKVLLIDADLRKPRMHDIFDVPNSWGLTDILQESTPISQYPPESLGRETAIPNLSILPSGPAVSTVNALLCSERLVQLLGRLRNDFDAVLIDTPPMLMLPDARIVGQITDGIILVFRARLTSLDDARAAGSRLREDGTRILGTILNDWRPQSVTGPYSKYYEYYDSYYSSSRTPE